MNLCILSVLFITADNNASYFPGYRLLLLWLLLLLFLLLLFEKVEGSIDDNEIIINTQLESIVNIYSFK